MSPMDLDKPAPKWLSMVLDDDSDHYTMKVNEEISSQYLYGLGYRPLNFVTIFGQARKGKSFLMNLLANEEQLFKVRNRDNDTLCMCVCVCVCVCGIQYY